MVPRHGGEGGGRATKITTLVGHKNVTMWFQKANAALFFFTEYKRLGRYLQQQSSIFLEVTLSLSSFKSVKQGMLHTQS